MDGMLSQDEINALLNGVDLSADSGADTATATAGGSTGEDLSDIEKMQSERWPISAWVPLRRRFFHLLIEK